MKSTQFVTLLCTLSSNEIADFGKHIKHLYSGHKVALKVFDYISKHAADPEKEKKLNSTTASEKAFKGKEGNNKARVLNSLPELRAWLKEYLLFQKANSGNLESKVLWSNILKERGLNAEFEETMKGIRQSAMGRDHASAMGFFQGVSASFQLYQDSALQSDQPNIVYLQQCEEDLDLFYTTMRLKIACEKASLGSRLSIHLPDDQLEIVNRVVSAPNFKHHPLLELYSAVHELLSKQDEKQLTKTIALLHQHVSTIDVKEMHILLSYIHNFVASQLRLGEEKQLDMLHKLNVLGVENGVFMERGEISHTQFANIVTVACKKKALKWASEFVKSHSHCLPAKVQSDAALFSKALIAYAKDDFKESMAYLEHVNFTDFYHAIRSKELTLRCLYETVADKLDLEKSCIAFDTYLKRNKRSHKEVVEAMRNTVGIIKAMSLGKVAKEKLLQAIASKQRIYLKDWLLEKAQNYKSNLPTLGKPKDDRHHLLSRLSSHQR